MARFQLLTRTRQITEYSCGASALQAVLHYWGRDVEETELMRIIGTSEDVGTYPENIVRGVRALGFQAEARDNLTLDEVARLTADGSPMIALAQVWRSQKSEHIAPEDEWDNGHYIVVLGVDDEFVYIQDPYLRMGKVMVARGLFVRHWHQVMGGEQAGGPKLMQLGILIRGDRPAPVRESAEIDPATIDFAQLGSFNLLTTHFDRPLMPFDLMDSMREVWASGVVRPDAVILVVKNQDGEVMAMEGGRLEEEHEVAAISVMLSVLASRGLGAPQAARQTAAQTLQSVGEGDFGLSSESLRAIAGKLEAGRSVLILLVENSWERRFRALAREYGGEVREQRLVSSTTIAAAARNLL